MYKENPLFKIPGPILPEQNVLNAKRSPVRAHNGEEWTEIYNQTTTTLKRVFNTQVDVILLVGSVFCTNDDFLGNAFCGLWIRKYSSQSD
ncbi:MAG: hypothetical protein A2X25_02455 [Chloroflexi bacterium GWB2_49_20]|nr:MAG: hypothetical protein A2X25_02455 [Chloroflexi bacterium GWB2_49_20]OGN79715.1 MAG: hypothetical protein A2X26_07435 [Chloroflexi bacterium GWC2_49_37]OGN85963.1 MAG: hypothetical protein A2X27_00195 [Chloroflexi bacterium GWD2_49_16]HBG73976.1 hypothetical protein [Anaerolineae bacterium]HCC78758.1 hypothetical protein [Anaerolineae bacterium]